MSVVSPFAHISAPRPFIPTLLCFFLLLSVVVTDARRFRLADRFIDTQLEPSISEEASHYTPLRSIIPSSAADSQLQHLVVMLRSSSSSSDAEDGFSYLTQLTGSQPEILERDLFVVYGSPQAIGRAERVEWLGAIRPEDKVARTLHAAANETWLPSLVVVVGSAPTDGSGSGDSFELLPNAYTTALRNELLLCSVSYRSTSERLLVTLIGSLAQGEDRLTAFRRLVRWLSVQPEVRYVENKMVHSTHNGYASKVVLDGWSSAGSLASTASIHSRGLRGEGQTVALADTGIDSSSCFFHDPSRGFPQNTAANTAVDPLHRKVVFYMRLASTDYSDGVNGHGTHVAGSIAGEAHYQSDASVQNAASNYNGVAYKSKLAFIDAEYTGTGYMFTDVTDMAADVFEPLRTAGGRISSHSWGCDGNTWQDCNTYNIDSHDSDKFLYDHPDSILLFAAGNSGSSGLYTIGAPATARNVLAVGASVNSAASWAAECSSNPYSSDCSYLSEQNKFEYMAEFSSRGPIYDDGRIKPDVVAPGHVIYSARSNGASSTLQCALPLCKHGQGCSNSQGVLSMSGTSMATPIAAGATALIRQYFTEGWYPTGARVASNSFTPSGPLLKAMLIQSAQHVTGAVRTSTNNFMKIPTNTPNAYEGFGRIQLERVLYFQSAVSGSAASDFTLWKEESTATANQYRRFCFSTLRGSNTTDSLRFTLVYNDYPTAMQSYSSALLNDIDIILSDHSGRVTYPNMRSSQETINNVEQIAVRPDVGTTATYALWMHARQISTPNVTYAIVGTGPALTLLPTGSCPQTCPNGCSARGTCSAGACICATGFTGADCGIATGELEECASRTYRASVGTISYFTFNFTNSNANLVLHAAGASHIYVSRSNPTPGAADALFTVTANGDAFMEVVKNTANWALGRYYLSVRSMYTGEVSVGWFAKPNPALVVALGTTTRLCATTYYRATTASRVPVYSYVTVDTTIGNPAAAVPNIAPQLVYEIQGGFGYASRINAQPTAQSSQFTVDPATPTTSAVADIANMGVVYIGVSSKFLRAAPITLSVSLYDGCAASATLSASSGSLADHFGSGYYRSSSSCMWNIVPTTRHSPALTFTRFDLDASNTNDRVLVYDGSVLLGTYTGLTLPAPLIGYSGSLRVQFTSDASRHATGFAATYRTLTEPPTNELTFTVPMRVAVSSSSNMTVIPLRSYIQQMPLASHKLYIAISFVNASGELDTNMYIGLNSVPTNSSYAFAATTPDSQRLGKMIAISKGAVADGLPLFIGLMNTAPGNATVILSAYVNNDMSTYLVDTNNATMNDIEASTSQYFRYNMTTSGGTLSLSTRTLSGANDLWIYASTSQRQPTQATATWSLRVSASALAETKLTIQPSESAYIDAASSPNGYAVYYIALANKAASKARVMFAVSNSNPGGAGGVTFNATGGSDGKIPEPVPSPSVSPQPSPSPSPSPSASPSPSPSSNPSPSPSLSPSPTATPTATPTPSPDDPATDSASATRVFNTLQTLFDSSTIQQSLSCVSNTDCSLCTSAAAECIWITSGRLRVVAASNDSQLTAFTRSEFCWPGSITSPLLSSNIILALPLRDSPGGELADVTASFGLFEFAWKTCLVNGGYIVAVVLSGIALVVIIAVLTCCWCCCCKSKKKPPKKLSKRESIAPTAPPAQFPLEDRPSYPHQPGYRHSFAPYPTASAPVFDESVYPPTSNFEYRTQPLPTQI